MHCSFCKAYVIVRRTTASHDLRRSADLARITIRMEIKGQRSVSQFRMAFFFRMNRTLMIFPDITCRIKRDSNRVGKVYGIGIRWVLVLSCWVLCSRDMGILSNNLVAVHVPLGFARSSYILRSIIPILSKVDAFCLYRRE